MFTKALENALTTVKIKIGATLGGLCDRRKYKIPSASCVKNKKKSRFIRSIELPALRELNASHTSVLSTRRPLLNALRS